MKVLKVALISLLVLGLAVSFSFAAGNAAKGKAMFNDPKFAGGSRACSECHPNGKGLEKAGDKKEFRIMGGTQKSLEEAVNACIVGANKGKALDLKSQQMQDVVAYIKSLKGGAGKKPAAGY
jgi:cytochrome c553